jgi:hypothetical protein
VYMRNVSRRLSLSLSRVLKVVRFRLGCSTLPSVAHRNQGVCRDERVCLCCVQGAPGDEYHALFECPATRAARAPFAHPFLARLQIPRPDPNYCG